MHKPVIGITCNTQLAETTFKPGMTRTFVDTDYVRSVTLAGGIPLLLPPVDDYAVVHGQVTRVDGLILTGGPDIDPLLYNEDPLEKIGAVNHHRDNCEFLVVKAADTLKKPLLGICRGIQVINVAYGGTLHQDVSYIAGCSVNHFQNTAQRDAHWHMVDIEPASALASIIGQNNLPVNSFHHQALKTVAPGFKVAALARDGVIEAVERPGEHFILGVQWHPELMAANNPPMLALFQALVRHACIS